MGHATIDHRAGVQWDKYVAENNRVPQPRLTFGDHTDRCFLGAELPIRLTRAMGAFRTPWKG